MLFVSPGRLNLSTTILPGIVFLGTFILVFAQSSSPTEAPAANAAPVVLSPFEVRSPQDQGYRVGAAVTGTGTAGLIKDTPLNISIVSQELIQDSGWRLDISITAVCIPTRLPLTRSKCWRI